MGSATCSCVQSEAAEPSAVEPKIIPVYSEQRLSTGSKSGKDSDSSKPQRDRSKKSFEAKQNEEKGSVDEKDVRKDSLNVVPSAFDAQQPCCECKVDKVSLEQSKQPVNEVNEAEEQMDRRAQDQVGKQDPLPTTSAAEVCAAPDEDPPLPPPAEPPPQDVAGEATASNGPAKLDGDGRRVREVKKSKAAKLCGWKQPHHPDGEACLCQCSHS